MAFQARWGELKKIGWHSKTPTGLSVDFTYLKPGRTKPDVMDLRMQQDTEVVKWLQPLVKQLQRMQSGNYGGDTTSVSLGVIEDGPVPSQRNQASDFEEAGSSSKSDVEFDVASSVVENKDAKDNIPTTRLFVIMMAKVRLSCMYKIEVQTNLNVLYYIVFTRDSNVVSLIDDPKSYTTFESDAENDDGDIEDMYVEGNRDSEV
ncbi:hypothetical protein PHMEG_0001582 [Phytophthora megakarya]|uniref:Uncharacterized protein n=1 Tax=Phytophthora megakarya TaxID=4795 RepID=A0A225X0S3_9STRA|nr:hypothetical protein PHMEG_0001582 [Phytophthora megakarya]